MNEHTLEEKFSTHTHTHAPAALVLAILASTSAATDPMRTCSASKLDPTAAADPGNGPPGADVKGRRNEVRSRWIWLATAAAAASSATARCCDSSDSAAGVECSSGELRVCADDTDGVLEGIDSCCRWEVMAEAKADGRLFVFPDIVILPVVATACVAAAAVVVVVAVAVAVDVEVTAATATADTTADIVAAAS